MSAAPFRVELHWPSRGVGMVDVAGEIDMHTAQKLEEVLAAAGECRPHRLIVDLSAVGFIDSIGLSVLVRNAKTAHLGRRLVRDRLRQQEAHAGLRDRRPGQGVHLPFDLCGRNRSMTPAASGRLTPSRLLIRVTPEPTHLLRARERLRDYLDLHCLDEEAIDEVVLAVDEACTNALRHSGSEQELEISLGFEADDLVAEVRDHGRGFDVASFDPGRVPEPEANDGRGLYLISRLMDELELLSDRGLVARMVKHGMHRPDGVAGDCALDQGDGARDSQYWQMRRRALTEEMGEAFAALDWEYRFVYCNGAALSLYDRALEEVSGRSIWDVFPAAEGLPVGQGVRRAMQLGLSSIEEFVSPALGHWLECRIYPTSSGVSLFVRDVDERKRKELERDGLMAELCESEASARRAEERYRNLFDSMLEGFCTIEMIFDAAGRPVDYRFLEVNSAFEKQTGLHDAQGRRIREFAPDNDPYWFEIYGKIAATGEPARFTVPATALGRIYDVSAFRVGGSGSRQVAILFDDISQRRQLEEEKDLLLEAAGSLTESMRLPDVLDRLARMTLEVGGARPRGDQPVAGGAGALDGRLLSGRSGNRGRADRRDRRPLGRSQGGDREERDRGDRLRRPGAGKARHGRQVHLASRPLGAPPLWRALRRAAGDRRSRRASRVHRSPDPPHRRHRRACGGRHRERPRLRGGDRCADTTGCPGREDPARPRPARLDHPGPVRRGAQGRRVAAGGRPARR